MGCLHRSYQRKVVMPENGSDQRPQGKKFVGIGS